MTAAASDAPRRRPRPPRPRSVEVAADSLPARLERLLAVTDAELTRRGVIRLAVRERPAPVGGTGAGLVRRVRTIAASVPSGPPARPSVPMPPVPRRLPSMAELRAETPTRLMGVAGELALRLRALTGRDIVDMDTLMNLAVAASMAAAVHQSHKDGRYEVDDLGFDREWAEAFLPLMRILYRRYWRVDTTGITHVPRSGGALLVSNHAGVLPLDGAMIKTALFEEGVDRHARALIAQFFFGLPVLSWFLRRSGQTIGHPDDTHRLLTAGELVLVFPEGVKGTGKPFRERYRLRRFGRGGFVQSAIRARVPIVPVSVVGSEEIYPMLADVRPVAAALGFPYFPITPSFPLLGPLGLVPLPTKWRIEFHEPLRTDEMAVEAADDPGEVMRVADLVRDTIQDGLIANLMERRGVFG